MFIYWEIINKFKDDNKIIDELILIINNIKVDLSHPNEYINSFTLNLLIKIPIKDLIINII